VTGSGLLVEEVARIQSRRHGFTTDHVLTFWVRPPGSRYPVTSGPATLDRLLTSIQAVPGIEWAAVNRCTPFSGCASTTLFLGDSRADWTDPPIVGRHYISADYFRVLGIPIVSGRALTADDRTGRPPVAIVNQSGAERLWPGENPIGKHVWFGTTTGPFSDPAHAVEIVGVAGDVKYQEPDQLNQPDRVQFYTSFLQFSYPDTMVIVRSPGPKNQVIAAMRRAVAAVDPTLPIYEAMTLDERISASVSRPRFNATLLSAFAGAALFLAAIGVYGMLSHSVSSQLREIAVRVALGAAAGRIVSLVIGQGMRLAAFGTAIGAAAAWSVFRLARSVLTAAPEWDGRLVGIAAVILLAVSAAAALIPAYRASAVDPAVVLRNE
jgi:putative ABC transport system permease protein